MVIFFEWHRTAMDQKSRSRLPMTGEDTGLGALASPLVGYLGKVQERASSLEYCPWCTSKGLTYVLRSYRVNLQESVTLCTNPQCLFPLVSRSLEDVLASLVPGEPIIGNKRKDVEKKGLIQPACKRLRSSEHDGLGPQSITDVLITQPEHRDANVVSKVQHAASKTDGERINGYHRDSSVAETSGQDENEVLDKVSLNASCAEDCAPPVCSVSAGHLQSSSGALLSTDGNDPALSPHCVAVGISETEDDFRLVKSPPEVLNRCCILDSDQFISTDICSAEIDFLSPQHHEQTERTGQKSLAAGATTCTDVQGMKSKNEDLSSNTITEELVPVPNQLFWRNSNNLCWLDSMLVALVNCKSLRKCKPKDEPERSPVWQLMRGYEEVCAAIKVHQQPGGDGVARVPDRVLRKADADLHGLRMSVFKLLQPKLHCKLGQRETPVFAVPLLLTMDSWVEPLFQSTFYWEFKCSECKAATKERVTKTLPTFTNILPDWRPLHAVHSAPCNVCRKRNQRRTMMLERVPPVFQLHFVEGLPDNDVRNYAFTFKGKHYSVTTVIQYNQQLKHFVTWICTSDGSWLEYDDLKHPDCKTHQRLPVPAEEIHIVFWEVHEDKEPQACSPSSTFEPPPCKNEMNLSSGEKDLMADETLADSPDRSLFISHNDTDIICALTASEDGSNVTDTTVTAAVDTSIGSATLLDTFEGLTHNDIVTLTLVEIKPDSDVQLVNNNTQTQDLTVPSTNETRDSAPDSSSNVIGSEMSDSPHGDVPTSSNSSESEDGSTSDPTFVPGVRGGRGRGRGRGRSKPVGEKIGKKAALSKTASHTSSPPFSEPSEVITNKPTSATSAGTQPASAVSSTNTSPLSNGQKCPSVLPAAASRWSFLLSKHPLHQVQKPDNKLAPTLVTQVKATPPTHSTPNPLRRQQIPGGAFPRPQLKTEGNEGLPLKAAEMYDAFGTKSSSTPSLLTSAELNGNSKLCQPLTSNHQKLLLNSTVVCGTALPMPGAKEITEISSSKKRSSQSSKVPPGLSETEVLRYKLIKKLKAKKKKLAKLNEMLHQQGGAGLRPDSTDLGSPNTVTSSTYDGSICDDFLSDLLSPATTASNLSPDSTGFLEMLASGQDGVEQLECGIGAVSKVNTCVIEANPENFLDDFLSQAVAQKPTEMETEALNALELFV